MTLQRPIAVSDRQPNWSDAYAMMQGSAAVAQLDRVLGYEPRGRGFESCQPRQMYSTGQLQKSWPVLFGRHLVQLLPVRKLNSSRLRGSRMRSGGTNAVIWLPNRVCGDHAGRTRNRRPSNSASAQR